MTKQQAPPWAKKWFAKIIKHSEFQVRTIPLKDSKDWVLDHGAIIHKSGLFFKIVGTSWSGPDGDRHDCPLIEQREVGTLGFMLLQSKGANKILVQAKIEPGNVGICQIAPTYQATASNTARVHGGKSPSYSKYFQINSAQAVFQTLQSEHGDRFLGKMNRNVMVAVKRVISPSPLHKWIALEQLLSYLDADYFINTDARSVLTCAPWDTLVGRAPFSKDVNPLTKQLNTSYAAIDDKKIHNLRNDLKKKRAAISEPKTVDLQSLKGWKINPYGIATPGGKPYSVKQISVTAFGREVAHWDQPIIDSKGSGVVDLFCTMIDGVMQLYMVPRAEAGLVYKVELGPSVVVEPGGKSILGIPKNSKIIAKVKQSDEGGRFFGDVTRYRIIQIPDSKSANIAGGYWLTLGEISQLLKEEGFFTNEARSVLSLLLKWL